MATSTNYGWAEPDNSSLVKNGASDIRTRGNAIDVSLWNSGFGQAGKNKIINGDFSIWQRGTSFTTSINNATYTADRFFVNRNGSGATVTVSQQAFTPGTAPVAGYEGSYFYRYNQSVAGTGATYGILISQRIEDVRTFAGQTITWSFWAKADSARSVNTEIVQDFGTGGSTAVGVTITSGGNPTLSTSWQRYSVVATLPSLAGKTIGTGNFLAISFLDGQLNATKTIDTWGWQVEYGSTATPFQRATGTIQGELAACQRYYERATAGNAYEVFAQGWATSTTNLRATYYYRVPKRVAATSLDFSTLRTSANTTVSAVSFDAAGIYSATVNATASTMVLNSFYTLLADNSTNAYLGFSAEL